jgi:hypothetical protein
MGLIGASEQSQRTRAPAEMILWAIQCLCGGFSAAGTPGRNLIAPFEKTSPRPPQNGWHPFHSEMKRMFWEQPVDC